MLPKRNSDADAWKPLREINVQLQEGLDFRSACRKAGIAFIQWHPTHSNHIRAIYFIRNKLHSGCSYKILTVLNEDTRRALCPEMRRKMNSDDVLGAIDCLLMKCSKTNFIHSSNDG